MTFSVVRIQSEIFITLSTGGGETARSTVSSCSVKAFPTPLTRTSSTITILLDKVNPNSLRYLRNENQAVTRTKRHLLYHSLTCREKTEGNLRVWYLHRCRAASTWANNPFRRISCSKRLPFLFVPGKNFVPTIWTDIPPPKTLWVRRNIRNYLKRSNG